MTGRADWPWLLGRYFQRGAWRGADYAGCRWPLNRDERLAVCAEQEPALAWGLLTNA